MSKLRLGILGTGNIAGQFAAGVRSAARAGVVAVGSRSAASAEAFARQFEIARAHPTYDALLADPAVDAIYLSLPNSMHHKWAIRAMRAGKHVLCEKPIAIGRAQAVEMFDVAAACGVVLVEAFMYRCHPLTLAVKAAVDSGAIGQLQIIRSSFCYRTTKIAGNVRFDPALAGGCLMDVGCYCVNFSRYFAGGEPVSVAGFSHRHPTGVDDLFAGTLAFDNGILATFTSGMSAQGDNTAELLGTEGYIEIPVPWKPPVNDATYILARGTPPKMDGPPAGIFKLREVVTLPVAGDLYGIEADAFADAVADGNPWITREDTIGNMETLDRLRKGVGVETR